MKKITTIFIVLLSVVSFAQSEKTIIQNYLDRNLSTYGLSKADVSEWDVQSVGSSESTGVTNYYVIQKYQGFEIFRALTNFSVKNGQVFYVPANGFVSNLSQKVNTTTYSYGVVAAVQKAYQMFGVNATDIQITETVGKEKYLLSNGLGLEDPVRANLVYQPTGNELRLAWDITFYTAKQDHLWSIRLDAVNGTLLEKNDLVISCNFTESRSKLQSKPFTGFNSQKLFRPEMSSPSNVAGGSYRVIPFNFESPNHTARQLIANPDNATASPMGWHNANNIGGTTASLIYTKTRGNNVWAQADYNGSNPTTASSAVYPDGGSSLVFDYSYPGTMVVADTYINAAVTNLFYMNNIMHDVWYQYGFNEVNGNFQQSNYSYGASGSDFVYADAQDGSKATTPSLNNANFTTPVDGSKPRMNMFLWSYRKLLPLLTVNSPSDIAGGKTAADNGFNPGHVNLPVAPNMIETDLVLMDDGSQDVGVTDNADGCSTAVNAAAISGKICVVRRSTSAANGGNPCTFIQKALNAQAAGAVGLVIVNNDVDYPDSPIGMSGADASITIPVINISKNDGEAIITKLKAGETVNAKLQSPEQLDLFVNSDGDFDNGIIAHEFGHGISTRLEGGRTNSSCLQNYEQMGEGWSDWFAMMMQIKSGDVGTTPRGLATFVLNQATTGAGLRSYPYCTDMAVNPLTFNNSNTEIPLDFTDTGYRYVIGDFWATVLWDLSWAYINKYGFDANIYTGTGGNNKIMRLVLDAIKLQPCNPSIIQGRDALFAADQATTGGHDYCMIAEVFTRRGVGLNASSGDSNDCGDQVEDFTPFPAGPNCTLAVDYIENQEVIQVYPNPSLDGIFNLYIPNYSGNLNLKVVDLNGRVVYNSTTNYLDRIQINLSELASGTYIINVSSENISLNKKIVKK